MAKDNNVTLEQLLESRDERAALQSYLIDEYKCPLISFTVIMPGSIKQNEMSEKIFNEGLAALRKALEWEEVKCIKIKVKNTGSEAIFSVNASPDRLKKLAVELEDKHRLGRLFDIDVIGKDKRPVSRSEYGYGERKCLICGEMAHACVRSRKHSVDELLQEIERLLSNG